MLEALSVELFASGEKAEQVMVGQGVQVFCAIAVVEQAAAREDVPALQATKGGERDAISAIELAEGIKEFGFEVRIVGWGVAAAARGFGVPGTRDFRVLGPWLRRRIGAYSFVNSHFVAS